MNNETNIADTNSVFKKIHSIMSDVGYVQKDARIQYGRTDYTAVSYDGMIKKIRPHFVKHAVGILPTIVSCETKELLRDEKHAGYRTEVTVRTEFVDLITGDNVSLMTDAIADDYSDKGPGKAYTYAVKMAILKVLLLESGDEEEKRVEAPKLDDDYERVSAEQVNTIRDLLIASKTEEGKMLEGMSKRLKHSFPIIEDLPASEYKYITRILVARAEHDNP